jgi:hypothetical protein
MRRNCFTYQVVRFYALDVQIIGIGVSTWFASLKHGSRRRVRLIFGVLWRKLECLEYKQSMSG